ncbi:hypothetical protein QTN25_009917 [Entamoeba marina]
MKPNSLKIPSKPLPHAPTKQLPLTPPKQHQHIPLRQLPHTPPKRDNCDNQQPKKLSLTTPFSELHSMTKTFMPISEDVLPSCDDPKFFSQTIQENKKHFLQIRSPLCFKQQNFAAPTSSARIPPPLIPSLL